MTTTAPPTVDHPLAMLTADEIATAVEVVKATGRLSDAALFAHVVLQEPNKEWLAAWQPGDAHDRLVRVQIVPGAELDLVEALVSVTRRELVEWQDIVGMRPTLLMHEAANAIFTTKEHPEYLAALARRGITDIDNVQIDPWPAGTFGYEAEEGRRISRCISFVREFPDDNGYARPIEGLIVHFDNGRNEVIEVIDHGIVPLPQQHARYGAEEHAPLRADLKPIEITQPEGPSFTVAGNRVDWQKWSFRVAFDPYEGLVLHQIAYDGRSILHRASVTEMVVPYGDPGAMHGWKNAFDAGEWGLGRMTQPLQLGCDCLGEIHYFDVTLANERGKPWPIPNAICMHEEDFGVLWKHIDLMVGNSEVRRSRRLVVSHFATVGNYEYGFFWYFYLDGNIQLEVKLTGILSVGAMEPGSAREFGVEVAPGVFAPYHQHMFCTRLDFDLEGTANRVYEVQAERMPDGPDNPWRNAFTARKTLLERESDAQRDTDASASRTWRIENTSVHNGIGQPVAYKLVPTMSTPTLLAHPESSVGQRAGFARHNVWVTKYAADERRGAGEYPNQHAGGDGLPSYVAADRSLVDDDIVVWYCFGVTHFPRPEDWPVMPVEYAGFLLQPVGFFDRNPALDVPPSSSDHCHE
ncbi:MAG TPA: primary-amine oxidase [Acidimicrobiia bacterium]